MEKLDSPKTDLDSTMGPVDHRRLRRWRKAQAVHFAHSGVFDQIYRP
jgi:ABC-type sulfate transport system substrate-binding protein